jgi:hypothetical protein
MIEITVVDVNDNTPLVDSATGAIVEDAVT